MISLLKRKYVILVAGLLYIIGILAYSYTAILPSAVANSLATISDVFPAMWDALTRALFLMMVRYVLSLREFNLSTEKNTALLLVSFVGLVVEVVLLNTYTPNYDKYSYIIFTFPTAFYLFNLTKNTTLNIKPETSKPMRNMSTAIYCVHPLVIEILNLIVAEDLINSILRYSIVAIVLAIVAYIIVKLSQNRFFRVLKYLY